MRLDRTLVREIRAANGDGSREAKFELLHKIDEARKEFSTPEIVTTFAEISRRHGRAVSPGDFRDLRRCDPMGPTRQARRMAAQLGKARFRALDDEALALTLRPGRDRRRRSPDPHL